MSDHDDLVQQFCELTSASASRAQEYLTASDWNLGAAVGSFFADDEEDAAEPAAGSSSQQPTTPASQGYTGPRTLDGRPAPQSAFQSSSSSSKKPTRKTGISTLNSLRGDGDGDDDDHSDEDDDEAERKGPRDLFAGGEKSGLAVQDPARGPSRGNADRDPANVIKDILAKAKANAKRASSASENDSPGPSAPSNFRGSGTTVGGEGTESRSIPARTPAGMGTREELPIVARTLHLWRDGFSIEDGPLRRYDDAEHAHDLQMIRSGRAPLHLMNVEPGQRCDVRLAQHEEDWHQLPRIYRPFGGEGRRLGSPVPGDSSTAFSQAAPTPAPAATTPSGPPAPANVDSNQPTVAVRFQMPDGSRLPARFNLTNTIGDLYEFAANTAPAMRTRPFIIQSTFPSKDHTDREQKLEEVDAFKRGGIAVVKWA
ncbi:unnamed protein product [Discula destructiva]